MNRRHFLKAAALAAISAPVLVKAAKPIKSKYAVLGRHPEPKRYYVRWDDHAGSRGEMSSPDPRRAMMHFWTMCEYDGEWCFRYTVTFHHGKDLLASCKKGQTAVTPAYCDS